jgi:hypothetical protein
MKKLKERACVLKNENKLWPYKKLSVFYNSCVKVLGRTFYYYVYVVLAERFMKYAEIFRKD